MDLDFLSIVQGKALSRMAARVSILQAHEVKWHATEKLTQKPQVVGMRIIKGFEIYGGIPSNRHAVQIFQLHFQCFQTGLNAQFGKEPRTFLA